MSQHGSDLKQRYLPPKDAATVSLDAQAITSATTYQGDFVDLGSPYTGSPTKLAMYFVPSSTLAGGTSLTYKLLSDADGSAGSEVTEFTSVTQTLAAGYEPVKIPIPDNLGRQYVAGAVTSVGTHTAGTVTSWVGPA